MECWKAIQGRLKVVPEGLKVVLEGLEALQGRLIQEAGRLASRPEPGWARPARPGSLYKARLPTGARFPVGNRFLESYCPKVRKVL